MLRKFITIKLENQPDFVNSYFQVSDVTSDYVADDEKLTIRLRESTYDLMRSIDLLDVPTSYPNYENE